MCGHRHGYHFCWVTRVELNFLITRHIMDYRSLEEFVVVEELVNLAMAPDDY